jgi:hypothetical protein
MNGQEKTVYTLMPLEKFKGVMGVDDRDDSMSAYCLVTATHTIERYCKRRLLRTRHFERVALCGDMFVPLREYPVTELLSVHGISTNGNSNEIIEPELYSVIPACGTDDDIPFYLSLSPALLRYKNIIAIKTIYYAGYAPDNVPPDLACACLELAVWNMGRYKGRRVGMTGTARGNGGLTGERFEMAMPENVRGLLEPYRRKVI